MPLREAVTWVLKQVFGTVFTENLLRIRLQDRPAEMLQSDLRMKAGINAEHRLINYMMEVSGAQE